MNIIKIYLKYSKSQGRRGLINTVKDKSLTNYRRGNFHPTLGGSYVHNCNFLYWSNCMQKNRKSNERSQRYSITGHSEEEGQLITND